MQCKWGPMQTHTDLKTTETFHCFSSNFNLKALSVFTVCINLKWLTRINKQSTSNFTHNIFKQKCLQENQNQQNLHVQWNSDTL